MRKLVRTSARLILWFGLSPWMVEGEERINCDDARYLPLVTPHTIQAFLETRRQMAAAHSLSLDLGYRLAGRTRGATLFD